MTYVNDWTNASGNTSLPLTSTWYYQDASRPEPWDTPLSITSTLTVGRRFKSNTSKGLWLKLPDGSLFRKGTAYSRCIARLFSGGAARWETKHTIADYRYLASDSRHTSGITFSNDLGFSQTTGIVRVSANTVNRAVAEALNKVRDNKIELGAALAESRKTIDYIADLVKRVVGLYRAFRKGQYKTFGRTFRNLRELRRAARRANQWKFASTAWLEYKYAVMPLLNDIRSGVEIAQSGLAGKTGLFSVTRTVTNVLVPDQFIQSATLKLDSTISGRADESAKVTFWGRLSDPRISSAVRLGLENPWAIAWEVVPFSFVIDWLLPIGDWLRSITATLGVIFVDGSLVKRVRATAHASPNNPGTGTFVEGSRPSGTCKVFAMQREKYVGFPWALPYVKSPFSTSHVTSAIALLIGQSRR